ncbi:hypothetical protein AS026_26510 [Rhizobium altiplani]|uniref:Uncharacterized protein n=1 Tax=Rhizobium altiplani TaxID=1864509 RepID=A0A120FDV0_9HYPH|nr:hypothetical protein AS026_26510 [Rhizobium altiplani]
MASDPVRPHTKAAHVEANGGSTAALLTFLVDQILKEAQDQALRRAVSSTMRNTPGHLRRNTFFSLAFPPGRVAENESVPHNGCSQRHTIRVRRTASPG